MATHSDTFAYHDDKSDCMTTIYSAIENKQCPSYYSHYSKTDEERKIIIELLSSLLLKQNIDVCYYYLSKLVFHKIKNAESQQVNTELHSFLWDIYYDFYYINHPSFVAWFKPEMLYTSNKNKKTESVSLSFEITDFINLFVFLSHLFNFNANPFVFGLKQQIFPFPTILYKGSFPKWVLDYDEPFHKLLLAIRKNHYMNVYYYSTKLLKTTEAKKVVDVICSYYKKPFIKRPDYIMNGDIMNGDIMNGDIMNGDIQYVLCVYAQLKNNNHYKDHDENEIYDYNDDLYKKQNEIFMENLIIIMKRNIILCKLENNDTILIDKCNSIPLSNDNPIEQKKIILDIDNYIKSKLSNEEIKYYTGFSFDYTDASYSDYTDYTDMYFNNRKLWFHSVFVSL